MNNWNKVKGILSKALELEAAQRSAFLKQANLSYEERLEVESLLGFEDEAEHLMSLSAVEFSTELFEPADRSLNGQTFGNYRIVRELGFGGMGAVYLAERIDGKFQQKVALKLLKREMNTAAFRRRFQQEREILAALDHPNIARLIDAGTTDEKIPFIAMEYINGIEIDDYCKKHKLGLNERLDLFCEICRIVDFAHRNLVVHRDLKPSNILVTEEGIPKLLDFGISKILSADPAAIASATVTRIGAMTPNYASPEQLQSRSVTTVTDVYSLGVILFELLTGHRPFETKEENLNEILKAVVEEEPPLPSRMLETVSRDFRQATDAKTEFLDMSISELETEVGTDPSKTAASASLVTVPDSFQINHHSLRGDLDNIVLKALKKDPEERYASAQGFSEDIRNYQRGLPVTARADTFFYRAEKFIGRNTFSVGAGVLVFLVLVSGVIMTLWQAGVARTERAKAERRFNDVRSLANSFLFKLSPKIEKLPGSTGARKELVTLALEYLDSLSKDASDDLELQRELAAAYEKVGDVQGNPFNPNIGDLKGALESYGKALLIREGHVSGDPGNAAYESDLAQNYKVLGEIHVNGGDYVKGKLNLDRSLEIREKILKRNPKNFQARAKLAEITSSRGNVPFYEYENKKAIEYYLRAQKIYEELLGEKPSDHRIEKEYAGTFINIGEAMGWDDDLKNGQIQLNKGLNILLKLHEKYPNDQTISRSLLLAYKKTADNYTDSGSPSVAITLFNRSIGIAEGLVKADPQNVQSKRDLAITTRKLAETLDSTGKSRESLEKMIVALNILKDLRDKDPHNNLAIYDVANVQFAAGGTYLTLKEYSKAIEILTEARDGFQKNLKIDPEDTYAARTLAFTYVNLGTNYAAIAEKSRSTDDLKNALDNKREGVERLHLLQKKGKLSEYDAKDVIKAENELKAIESKLRSRK